MIEKPTDNIISLSELIEQRLRKQQEIDYYKETLIKLERKIRELSKEVDITSLPNEYILCRS